MTEFGWLPHHHLAADKIPDMFTSVEKRTDPRDKAGMTLKNIGLFPFEGLFPGPGIRAPATRHSTGARFNQLAELAITLLGGEKAISF
jgi:hypothetical protein